MDLDIVHRKFSSYYAVQVKTEQTECAPMTGSKLLFKVKLTKCSWQNMRLKFSLPKQVLLKYFKKYIIDYFNFIYIYIWNLHLKIHVLTLQFIIRTFWVLNETMSSVSLALILHFLEVFLRAFQEKHVSTVYTLFIFPLLLKTRACLVLKYKYSQAVFNQTQGWYIQSGRIFFWVGFTKFRFFQSYWPPSVKNLDLKLFSSHAGNTSSWTFYELLSVQ